MEEFYAQGDAEKELGIAVSMNCDRRTVSVAKSQVGFITFLVGPVFKALTDYAPHLQPMYDQLQENLKHFAREAQRAEMQHV